MNHDLTVSIASTNEKHFLGPCLDSLAPEREDCRLAVVVVDNACTDGTAELVREHYPWVRLIQQPARVGYSGNNNAAIRAINSRYTLVLNPDTIIPRGTLAACLAFLDANPQVGICGPRLVFPNGETQPSCRRFPTVSSVVARRSPLRRWLQGSATNARHLMADFDHSQTAEVDWLLGACLFVRQAVLVNVGLMDAGFVLYAEDIDWCYRARQAGWKVFYYAGAQITHNHQARSDRRLLSWHSWVHTQSMWRYYRKHLAPRWLRLTVHEERLPEA
jgi:GT2 family glycosyltransferase